MAVVDAAVDRTAFVEFLLRMGDNTLILIDGEPVVGRTTGTLDLERLAVTDVERVEVVRGPLSARYGTDALAGVVNLITERPDEPLGGQVRTRYGTHGTSDVAVHAETGGTTQASMTLQRYASAGYDLVDDYDGVWTRFDDVLDGGDGDVESRAGAVSGGPRRRPRTAASPGAGRSGTASAP